MRVAIGSDHRGFDMKRRLVNLLEQKGHEVVDLGCHRKETSDYPDQAFLVAQAIADGKADRGILICGTGIGMTIAANKVSGIRAALCGDVFTARMSREHNDANVLALGGRLSGRETGLEILRAWIETPFAGGRHARRVDKIMKYEAEQGTT